MLIDQETYITAEEVAQALKVKTSTVYGWVRRKELPCVKIGPRLVRFRQCDLEKLTRVDEKTAGGKVQNHLPEP